MTSARYSTERCHAGGGASGGGAGGSDGDGGGSAGVGGGSGGSGHSTLIVTSLVHSKFELVEPDFFTAHRPSCASGQPMF